MGDGRPSGFERPLEGWVGKANSRDNPYADRATGSDEIYECKTMKAIVVPVTQLATGPRQRLAQSDR